MVVYDDTSTEPVRVFDSGVVLKDPETFGEYRLTYRTGDIVSPRIDAAEPLSARAAGLLRSGDARNARPRSSAALGLEVVQMIEAADRSHASGGANVAVEALEPLSLAEPRVSALDALTDLTPRTLLPQRLSTRHSLTDGTDRKPEVGGRIALDEQSLELR